MGGLVCYTNRTCFVISTFVSVWSDISGGICLFYRKVVFITCRCVPEGIWGSWWKHFVKYTKYMSLFFSSTWEISSSGLDYYCFVVCEWDILDIFSFEKGLQALVKIILLWRIGATLHFWRALEDCWWFLGFKTFFKFCCFFNLVVFWAAAL